MSSGFSYPQPTFQSSIYNPAFYLTLDASGYLTIDYAQTLYLSKDDYIGVRSAWSLDEDGFGSGLQNQK
ncbi:unnamed protein product [Phytophthora lilii]|uniref:Unnamed protein product n=1 Tax=Phytophthora lilii TaxID=2077276 RepID=A0A9W6YL76_9STRA|nr:unnamed protein product [Phytophthora lilii]